MYSLWMTSQYDIAVYGSVHFFTKSCCRSLYCCGCGELHTTIYYTTYIHIIYFFSSSSSLYNNTAGLLFSNKTVKSIDC